MENEITYVFLGAYWLCQWFLTAVSLLATTHSSESLAFSATGLSAITVATSVCTKLCHWFTNTLLET